eukprot:PhM_4_TR9217/c0_g1_i1/m.64951/K01460/gsp; glutathionylspermidine amidase/synthetase
MSSSTAAFIRFVICAVLLISLALAQTTFAQEQQQQLQLQAKPFPFGYPLAESNGVIAFSNQNGENDPNACQGNHYGLVYTGWTWQCVEYARRYLVATRGISFGSIDNAYQIWDLETFLDVSVANATTSVPIVKHSNGRTTVFPEAGSLLIYDKSKSIGKTGHVAVITSTNATHVHVTEQNYNDFVVMRPRHNFSRAIPIKKNNVNAFWTIETGDETLLGWIVVPE